MQLRQRSLYKACHRRLRLPLPLPDLLRRLQACRHRIRRENENALCTRRVSSLRVSLFSLLDSALPDTMKPTLTSMASSRSHLYGARKTPRSVDQSSALVYHPLSSKGMRSGHTVDLILSTVLSQLRSERFRLPTSLLTLLLSRLSQFLLYPLGSIRKRLCHLIHGVTLSSRCIAMRWRG